MDAYKIKTQAAFIGSACVLFGTPVGNRTPDSAVRGLRLNLLTTRAYQGKKKYTISFIFRQVNLIHFFCVLKTDKKAQGIYSNYYKMLRKKREERYIGIIKNI